MINESTVRKLVEEKLNGTDMFLTDLVVKKDNTIHIFIDGDQGVGIEECVAVSRYVESNLNREEDDFSLQVSSAGVDHPLIFPRQYRKNAGRNFRIETTDGKILTGKLLAANDENIELQTEIKKGRKVMPGVNLIIQYKDIAKAYCLVSFKKKN